MKSLKKISTISILGLVCAIGAGFFVITNAQGAEVINDSQINLIKTNCISVRDTLTRIHASDALLRVNMGQIYESISTKLMDGFNGRVVGNNLNGMDLVSVSSQYEHSLDKFRADYINYEGKMSIAISIDCTKQPVAFFDAVTSARSSRKQVGNDIKDLNQLIRDYKEAVNKLEKDFQLLNRGVN